MFRAIEIAKNAIRSSYPNPMVGCVIVHNNSIISEGFTSPYGGPHAEVNAIESVEDKNLLKNSQLYVTLEPCSHIGLTPPCANLISSYNIPEVYIGCTDPNPEVAGRGLKHLEDSGCKVTTGVLKEACEEHHKRFLCFHTKHRPYIVLKWAQSKDGFFAPDDSKRETNPKPFWISGNGSRQLVHKWRSEEHAILIGINTLLKDNPKLDVRLVSGIYPIPILIDPHLKVNSKYNLFHNPSLILITDYRNRKKVPDTLRAEFIDFKENSVEQILDIAYQNKILSILIEGGKLTIDKFLQSNFWDEARVIKGSTKLNNGLHAPQLDLTISKKISIEEDIIYLVKPTNEV